VANNNATLEPLCRPMSPPPAPLLVDARTAAAMLTISERTLWQLTHDGELPSVRINRAVRYDPRDLRDLIERRKTPGVALKVASA
jgi:predicted DNA-binding transcriptional regulator AlpA